MNLGERERRRERRGNAERRREGRREGKRFDPWVSLVRVKMDNPAVTAWRHRMRVQEELVKMTHPQREHIERVLESEERRVRDDARAILRFRHIAGMSTQLDIEWPPRDEVTVRMEDGGEDDYSTTSSSSSEEERGRSPPPPYCRDRSHERGGERRGPGGGRRDVRV